jgi:uncharacterized membrane protein
MPPVHPVLVHFPVSLITVALGADVIGHAAERRDPGARLLVPGCRRSRRGRRATGFIDMYRADLAEATHRFVHLHRDIGLLLLAALALLAVWRWRIWRGTVPADRVGWPYLLSAIAVFTLVVFQGWFGGELVYGHGAGVSAAGQGVVSPEEGQMGLAPFAGFTETADDHHGQHQ